MDSNPYSGLEVDSITPFQAYIDKAKSEGMKAIAFTEHGAVLHNVAKRQACEKAGLKYINAEEFYVTEKLIWIICKETIIIVAYTQGIMMGY